MVAGRSDVDGVTVVGVSAVPGRSAARARRLARAVPLVLVPSMTVVFAVLGVLLGPARAWWVGFAVYWLVWGIAVPVWLLGPTVVRGLLSARGTRPRLVDVLLLAGPPLAAAAGGWLLPGEWSVGLLVVAAGFAVMNGTCEEVIWRGVPLALEPDSRLWGVVVPSIGFGVWHVAPWAADPTAGSPLPLMASAVVLGVVYAVVARRTRTLRWVVVSHGLVNLAALSTYAALI